MTRIVHGANEVTHKLDSATVGWIRKRLIDVLNLHINSTAFIGGTPASETCAVKSGDILEFVHENGEKGLGRLLDPIQLCLELGISTEDYERLLIQGLPVIETVSKGHLHSEYAVDRFFERLGDHSRDAAPTIVDSNYVSEKLNCTTTWIAKQARDGYIPSSCVVSGTGNGKPWKFHRLLIDKWVSNR